MKKPSFVIIISLIFIFISLSIAVQLAGIPPESSLVKAFKDSGAELVNAEITFTASTGSGLKASAEIKAFYNKISKELGADGAINPEKVENESFEGIELNNSSGTKCNYTLRVLKSKLKSELDRCYVTLYLVDSSTTPVLSDMKVRLTGIFNEFHIKPGINTCLTGRYKGKVKSSEMNQICTGIFKSTAARKVDGIRENNLISVSAYSKALSEPVVVDGKKVNLNFAARYNSYEDKTYIWLATPLITTEY